MWWNYGTMTFDLGAVTLNLKFLFALSPERMQILDWYLQGGTIRVQMCVICWHHGAVTFDFGPVIFGP
jgi:hypothetical protein